MGLSLGNYSLVELGGVARGARDSALQNLRQAERQIDQVRQLLRQEKGIGAEFYLQTLDKFQQEMDTVIRGLQRVK